jgi:prepilin-type N-terminal cleavage/methylation domain-containing protein
MRTKANKQPAAGDSRMTLNDVREKVSPHNVRHLSDGDDRGFTLAELMIAMAVFVLIIGSVVMLLGKSQAIFRTEQGVSEMEQNARLLMDFLTRDIQQSKENALGLGSRFRSIYSYNGVEGKTDEVTIVSSDTESRLPAAALPLIAASTKDFSAGDRYVELLPNGASRVPPLSVINALTADEEFVVSALQLDGSVQFDFIRVKAAKLTPDGAIGISFEPVEHRGVQPEVPFGETYQGGSFAMRPCTIKRYFVDRTDHAHPTFALSVNDGSPIPIARNVVAFQLRYLEAKDGEVEGRWVKQQNISRQYKTLALEVTMTARTEIKSDQQAERLVTLASVIRPRLIAGGGFGSSPGGGNGTSSPGLPGDGGSAGGGGNGGNDGPGGGPSGGYPGNGYPSGYGSDGSGASGFGSGKDGSAGGYNHETRRIGKQPRLGERLNERP